MGTVIAKDHQELVLDGLFVARHLISHGKCAFGNAQFEGNSMIIGLNRPLPPRLGTRIGRHLQSIDMPPLVTLTRCLAVPLIAAIVFAACGETPGVKIETVPPRQTPPGTAIESSATPLSELAPPSTATLSPTPEPSPTAVPATATSVPAPSIEFVPAQIVPGGTAIVYLGGAARSATLTFDDRQYPMLQSGNRWWAIVGIGAFAEPGLYTAAITYTTPEGTESLTTIGSLSVIVKNYPSENIELDPETASLLAPEIVQAELVHRSLIFSGFTAQRLWSGPFRVPATGVVSSIYGQGRSYNGGPITSYHHGTDFIGGMGDPVVAAAAGLVAFAGELQIRGTAIVLDHGAGVFSAYHHLSSIAVVDGQLVAAGERIGAIGSTGLVTGPHLHWEVIVRGVEVDGQLWLQGFEIGP